MYGPYGHMWSGVGWVWMLLSMIIWFLVVAGLIAFIIWAVRRYAVPEVPGGESALDIIKKRYARGEINQEEFQRMKQELS